MDYEKYKIILIIILDNSYYYKLNLYCIFDNINCIFDNINCIFDNINCIFNIKNNYLLFFSKIFVETI
jgi:hypothetical protein